MNGDGVTPVRATLVLLTIGLALSACAAGPGDVDRPTIRVAYAGPPDFEDLASLVAHERLRVAGYEVEAMPFALSELGAEALARGDVQFANGAVRSYWAARARGAPIVTLMEHVVNVHRLVARDEIRDCQGLDGTRFGIQSEGAAGSALLRAYLDAACPTVKPDFHLIPHSENRTAAMVSQGLDAAVLELSDVLWLFDQYPDRFHMSVDFQARWPHLPTTGVHVNASFAAANPSVVRAYVRARVLANRSVLANPGQLLVKAEAVLGPSATWSRVADAYVASVAWSPSGGLTADGVEMALTMLSRYGGLPDDLQTATVADLSVLESVLADLDRRRLAR